MPPEDFSTLRIMKREEAKDAIVWVNIIAKLYFDAKYKTLNLKEDSEVFLTLYRGYKLRGLGNKKLSLQRAGLFKILVKVDKLVYKLDLPPLIRIYPVVSIA